VAVPPSVRQLRSRSIPFLPPFFLRPSAPDTANTALHQLVTVRASTPERNA
jgi:hypothetical protein